MSSREIDEIKSKIDVAEFLGEYIKLIPAGATYKALCPFHNEKTPSLVISPQKQIWRCFGCNEGGDIFSFLEKIEGVGFGEALKILANKAGVKLESRTVVNKELDSHKERLFILCDLAARYFHKVLLDSSQAETARKYLGDRGVSDEIIMDFKIGYSIDSWDGLVSFLKKKGFSDKEIFGAGLSVQKTKGVGFYDRFRGRIMFPICDIYGRTVGFGGRIMAGATDTAKYINSPQGEIYNKSVILYGLNLAKDQIKKGDLCILVEGYMDVVPSHQVGVKNVVSISGTALTIEQIKLIKRFTSNIALALDMDSAGQTAAERSIELAMQEGMEIKVITLPFGKDPGECIKNNPSDWPKAIKEAKSVMEYFFAKVLIDSTLDSPENTKKAVQYLLKKISNLSSKIDQDYWIKKLSNRVSVSENILWEELKRQNLLLKNPNNSRGKSEVISEKVPKIRQDSTVFKRLLGLIFMFPTMFSHLVDNLAPDNLENDSVGLYKKLIIFYNSNSDLINRVSVDNSGFDLFDSFKQFILEKESDMKITSLVEESFLLSQNEYGEFDLKEAKLEMMQLIKSLKLDYITKKIESLKRELERAEVVADKASVDPIYSKISELLQQKNSIK